MKVGATRSGPRSRRTSACSTIPAIPPIAVPNRIPTRSGAYAPSSFASATASCAAPSARRTFRSSRRASFGEATVRRVEVLHLGSDAHRELARVERGDPVDAALARDRGAPRRRRVAADRRHRAKPRDHDSLHSPEPRVWTCPNARPQRPVPADGGGARRRAPVRRRLAVRAEVGRLPRRARERQRRARALVAQRPPAAALLPGAARGRRRAASPLRARRRDRDRARRRARLRRDADAAPSRREPRAQALRRDPGDVRRVRPAALEGQADAREADREAARRAREGRRRRRSSSPPSPTTSSRDATGFRRCRRPASTA